MMRLRPFRHSTLTAPGSDAWRRGTRYEPGHRSILRAYIEPDQAWATCAYNRHEGRFWVRWRGTWSELAADAVRWWTQMPQRPCADPDIPTPEVAA